MSESNLAWAPSWRCADFFTTLSNLQAFRAVTLAPDSPECRELWGQQVLLILGPEGSGKTHLSEIWSETRLGRGESLGRGLSPLLTRDQWHGITPQAQEGFILDGLDKLLNNREQEVGFQHFLDALKRTPEARLLLTARIGAGDEGALAKTTLPDLKTRLSAIPRCVIQPPDDLLLEAVLSKLFNDRQIRPDSELLKWLLRHRERSYASALAVVSKLDEAALQRRRKINLTLVREVFSEAS